MDSFVLQNGDPIGMTLNLELDEQQTDRPRSDGNVSRDERIRTKC